MEVAEPYVFSEIISMPDFFIACNKHYICLTEINNLVFTSNFTHGSWNIMDVGDTIKGIKLQNKGNWIAVATSKKNLLIIDLITKSLLQKLDDFYTIEHFRWHLEEENSFFMVRSNNTLEKFQSFENESNLIKIPVPGIIYFELVHGDENLVIVVTMDGEVQLVKYKEKSFNVVDRLEISEVGGVKCIDSDIFCVQCLSFMKFFSVTDKFRPFVVRKQIMKFEPISGVLLFSDHLSNSATIIPLSVFKVYKYEGIKYEINFIDTQLELELIPKASNKVLELAVRHNNKVFIYQLSFDKTLGKSNPDLYVFSKDAVNSVLENLTKRFEEALKKLDKALLLAPALDSMQKSMQYSLDKHSEENSLNLTSTVYTSLIQSFKLEILSTLTSQLENDLRDILNKFSYSFQDRLKIKVERNNREEERSKKLNVHLKSIVINFMTFEDHLKKTISRKNKNLNEFDLKCLESGEVQGPEQNLVNSQLKSEIDGLLHKKKFENAIYRALQEGKFIVVYNVLQVLNPKPLIEFHCIGSKVAFNLFSMLLNNIHQAKEYPDVFVWLEELVRAISCNDIQSIFSKIVDESFKFPQMNSLARICSKKLEEGFKVEINNG